MWGIAGCGKVALACVYMVLLLCSGMEVSVEGVLYEVNLVVETTNTTEAQQIVSMAQLASEEVSLALAPHALHLTVLDYASDLASATQYTLAAGQNTSVLALIPSGPQSVVDSISALGRWLSLPLLGFDTGNSSLAPSPLSTFYSVHSSTSFIVDALEALFKKYRWNSVGILYRNSLDDSSLARKISEIQGINAHLSPPIPVAEDDDFLEQFQFIVKYSINVVVLVSSDPHQASELLFTAAEANLFNAGRAFITVAITPENAVRSAPAGTILLANEDVQQNNREEFVAKLHSLDPNIYPGTGPSVDLYRNSILAYDAVHVLGSVLEVAGGAASRNDLLTTLPNTVFNGYSGRIQFDPVHHFTRGNAEFWTFSNSTSAHIAMTFNGTLYSLREPIWPGNSTHPPASGTLVITLAAVMTVDNIYLPYGANLRYVIAYAVEAVNNDPSLLPPNVTLASLMIAEPNASGVISDTVPLDGYGIAGVVGAISSSFSILVQNVVSKFGIPQISPSSTSPTLSTKSLYPTFYRTCPPDDMQGKAIIELARIWQWTEIAIISSTDAYGTGIVSALSAAAAAHGITITITINVEPSVTELSAEMERLKNAGTRVLIIAHTEPAIVAAAMFVADCRPVAVVGTDAMVPADLETYFSHFGAPLEFIQGWIGLLPSGGNGPVFDEYLANMRAHPPTEEPSSVISIISSGYFLVASTIDTILVYADAIKRVLQAGGNPSHGPTLLEAIRDTEIVGLTGSITFDAYGNRIGPYDVKNFVGRDISVPARFEVDGSLKTFSPIIWPDGTSNIPLSTIPRIQLWLKWGSAAGITLSILSGLGILACVVILIILYFQRNSKVITSATWQFLILMMAGAILGYGSIFTWIGYPKRYLCALRIWLPPMAFIIILAPLLAKTWRLHRIFTLRHWKVAPIPLWKLTVITCVLILGQIIICILWISLGTIDPALKDDKKDRRYTYATCGTSKSNHILTYVTFGYLGVLVVVGAYLAFRVRKLPRDFNESRWIGFSIYNTLLFSVIILILGYSLKDFPVTVLILICICTIAVPTGVVCFMMAPKLWDLLRHPERRSGSQPGSTPKSGEDTSVALRTLGASMRSERIQSTFDSTQRSDRPRLASDYSLAPGELTHAGKEALKKERRRNTAVEEISEHQMSARTPKSPKSPQTTMELEEVKSSKASASPSPPDTPLSPNPSNTRVKRKKKRKEQERQAQIQAATTLSADTEPSSSSSQPRETS